MKKHIILILLAILVLCFSSCDFNVDAPDIVTIEGKEYKKSFVDNLYLSYELISGEGITVSENRYYKYSLTPYDCYVTYDSDIYFAKNNFDEAMLYYSEPNNFNFLCLFGNAIDPNEQRIIKLENINCEIFNSLVKFSKDNAYNPLALFKDEKNLIKIPVADPDDWIAAEIHFYKESKDGAFKTSKAKTVILHENKLYLLYRYDFSDDEAPVMLVKEIPSEIGDYFCAVLKQLPSE